MIKKIELFLPSPYLIYPSPFWADLKYQFRSMIFQLIDTALTQKASDKTVTETVFLKYLWLVMTEFYRQVIDNNFPSGQPKVFMKPKIALEVNLWITTFKMLERMFTLMHNPTNTLFRLISERGLLVFIATRSQGQLGATLYIRKLQSENRKLQGLENPFDQVKTPFTWDVIEQAIALANINDDFRRNYYMPLVRARQELVAQIKEERARVYYEGRLKRQGRRKEPKSEIVTQQ